MGIRNLDKETLCLKTSRTSFPSPCGEMGIRNAAAIIDWKYVADQVSVPLRGNGYKEPYEVETVVIFSFQGTVAPNYGN